MRVLSRLLLALALILVGGTGFMSPAAPVEAACCEEACPCPCPPPPRAPGGHRLPAAAPVATPAPAPTAARKLPLGVDPLAFAAFASPGEAPSGAPQLPAAGRGRDPDLGRHLALLHLHRI